MICGGENDSEYDFFKEETDDQSSDSVSENSLKQEKQGFVLQRRWQQDRDVLIDYDKVKKGKFSEDEINQVLQVLQDFINEFKLTKVEFDNILENSKTYKIRVWPRIAQYFPKRTVKSIYRLIHRTFQTGVSGRWSQVEENKLKQLVNQYGRKWKFIGKELNRMDYVVRLKYYMMGDINHQFRDKNNWTINEVIQFMNILHEQSGVQILRSDYQIILLNKVGPEWQSTCFKINLRKVKEYDLEIMEVLISILQMEKAPLISNYKWNNIALQIHTKSMYDLQRLWRRLKSQAC